MATARSSWFQQEQEENRHILEVFWKMRVKEPNRNEISIRNIKDMFLVAAPPENIGGKEWKEKLDKAWIEGSVFEDFEKFWKFFEHVPSLKAVALAEGLKIREGEDKPKQEAEARVSNNDLHDIAQYTSEKNLSIVIKLGSQKSSVESFCSPSKSTSDIFSIHSIGKLFTGVLALALIREGIISDNDMSSTIQLEQSAKDKLSHAPLIQQRLGEVTLHQAMIHTAGLGDYLRNYSNRVENSISTKTIPSIKSVEDFLQFVENTVTAKGERNYSNTGILLAGLSLEYLYKKHKELHPEKKLPPLDFNGLMERYVTGHKAAKMTFTPFPPEHFKYNTAVEFAKYIVGGPAGGSFTTTEDLQKFAQWLYDQCNDIDPEKPNFVDLITKYGQEFCPYPQNHTIEHGGDYASGSAYFSLNWENGNTIIVLNDQRAMAASEVGRAAKDHIFLQEIDEKLLQQSESTKTPNPFSNRLVKN